MQQKPNQDNQKNDFIFYQNLRPGESDSFFIQKYRQECIETENDPKIKRYREDMLKIFPPVLTFRNKIQEDDFYKKRAEECMKYCCGSMIPPGVAAGTGLEAVDLFKFSAGTGRVYEGSMAELERQLTKDIQSAPFGSPEQKENIEGMKDLRESVEQRQSFIEHESAAYVSDSRLPNPFQMTPKPDK